MSEPDRDLLEELIGPVCMIAELDPIPLVREWQELIRAARIIKDMHGFHVETIRLDDSHD